MQSNFLTLCRNLTFANFLEKNNRNVQVFISNPEFQVSCTEWHPEITHLCQFLKLNTSRKNAGCMMGSPCRRSQKDTPVWICRLNRLCVDINMSSQTLFVPGGNFPLVDQLAAGRWWAKERFQHYSDLWKPIFKCFCEKTPLVCNASVPGSHGDHSNWWIVLKLLHTTQWQRGSKNLLIDGQNWHTTWVFKITHLRRLSPIWWAIGTSHKRQNNRHRNVKSKELTYKF